MVYMAPLNPDSYRDNEKHVDNFADHLRQKAVQEQRNIADITGEEMHRFKDVMFWVNTQHGGSQLRLRDDHGKVISKLKAGAQFKILWNGVATIDNDRNKSMPDEHIWVEVEVDAANTEAGGTGPVRWWVSTEYIQSLSEPIEPVAPKPLDPVLDNPDSWGDDVPEPPKPNPEVVKPKTEETEKPGTLQSPDASYTEVPAAPVSQTPVNETEKPGNLQSPDAKYTEVPTPPVSATQTPETQKTEKPGTLQSPDTKHTEAPTVNPQTPPPTNETEKPGTVQFAPEETRATTPEPEKKKWFFSSLNDTLNNFYTDVYRKITGWKPVVSEQSTTTTNSGELVIKPANADEKPATTVPETVTTPETPQPEKKKIVTDPTE